MNVNDEESAVRGVSTSRRSVASHLCSCRWSWQSSLDLDSEDFDGMRDIFRVASYHFYATFGRRWGGYVSFMLLITLAGGLSMASLAGARRTDSLSDVRGQYGSIYDADFVGVR